MENPGGELLAVVWYGGWKAPSVQLRGTRPTMILSGLLHLVSRSHMVSADRCSVSMVLAMMEARQGPHWNDDGEQIEQEIQPVLGCKHNRSRGLIDSGTENG